MFAPPLYTPFLPDMFYILLWPVYIYNTHCLYLARHSLYPYRHSLYPSPDTVYILPDTVYILPDTVYILHQTWGLYPIAIPQWIWIGMKTVLYVYTRFLIYIKIFVLRISLYFSYYIIVILTALTFLYYDIVLYWNYIFIFQNHSTPYLVGSIIIYKICRKIGLPQWVDSITITIFRIKQYTTSRITVLIFMYLVVFSNESHFFSKCDDI